MSEPRTTAVIVSYRARDFIGRTLETLRQSHEANLLDCIIVDNASGDGTADLIRDEHNWARIIESNTNLGFARGCNLGAQHATTPYVLFINPDAELEPDALSILVRFLDDRPRAGMVAPAIVDPDGALQEAGDLPSPLRIIRAAAGRGGQRRIQPGEAPFQVDWLCGAVLLVRKSLLDDLGGFDPRFFLYFEETDLCLRARRRGTELWAVGTAVARHADGAVAKSTEAPLYNGCIATHYFCSRYYYLVKHHGWIAASATEIAELLLMAVRASLCWLLRRESREFVTRLRAPILRLPPRDF